MLSLIVLTLVGFLAGLFYWGLKRKNFWKGHSVPHVESQIFFGNFAKVIFGREADVTLFSRLYNHPVAKDQPFIGFNLAYKPAILLRDPELIKRVLIKDFDYFSNRHSGLDGNHDPVGGNNLFQIDNPVWRSMRVKLTPVFSTGKMRHMFPLLLDIGDNFNERLRRVVQSGEKTDVRELAGAFTLDSIAMVALATETRSLLQDKPSDFLEMMSESISTGCKSRISMLALFFFPEIEKMFKLTTFSALFNNTIKKIFAEVYRRRIQSGQARGDLIDALIDLRNIEAGDKDTIFKDNFMVSQAAAFMFAGFETSASTITFAIYELARNLDVQEKLREELRKELGKNNGKINYEMAAGGLSYLNQFIKEVTRLYTSVPFLDRTCLPPNGETHYSLEPFSDFKVPVGMPVYIPTFCLQRDPQHFPEPEKFDPDRFDPEKTSINDYTFIPFGTGPRVCIGERFGKMQISVAIIQLLRSFKVQANERTPKEITFDSRSLLLRSAEDISVSFIRDELFIT